MLKLLLGILYSVSTFSLPRYLKQQFFMKGYKTEQKAFSSQRLREWGITSSRSMSSPQASLLYKIYSLYTLIVLFFKKKFPKSCSLGFYK